MNIGANPLSIDDVEAVAFGDFDEPIRLSSAARQSTARAANCIAEIIDDGGSIYGVTTGFGANRDRKIPPDKAKALQARLIRSHACGVGDPLSESEVRAMMLLRANALAQGHSGVRPLVIDRLLDLLNHRIHPVIPTFGSVGASGDLCPLAHMALPLLGEGRVTHRGKQIDAAEALEANSLEPIDLEGKDGIALLNGTQAMTAIGSLSLARLRRGLLSAELIGAMSLEALGGRLDALDPRIHEARRHSGQTRSAEILSHLLRESDLADINPGTLDGKTEYVQDSYSIRCMPQVHGATRDAIDHVESVLVDEINAVTDNPLVFPDDDTDGAIVSGGNFHGQPVGLALDYLKTAASELGSIAERRTAKLTDANHSEGLPAFLSPNPGLNSGMMVPQYVSASLVTETKHRAAPATVDSIPTSANSEDHVSMGMHAAIQCRQIADHLESILAIEYLTAAQAQDLRPSSLGRGAATKQAYELLREHVPKMDEDRMMAPDIEKATKLIRTGRVADIVEART